MKENQPDLLAALADAFDDGGVSPRERKLAEAERQTATRCNKGHGRIERRTLTSTTSLNDYADWPGVAQCFKLVRERTAHGKTTSETVFGITSVPRERADARRLLTLTRQHWQIENGVFHVRDVTMGEGRLPRADGRRTDDPVDHAERGAQPAERTGRRQQGRRPAPPRGPSARSLNAGQALGMRIERP